MGGPEMAPQPPHTPTARRAPAKPWRASTPHARGAPAKPWHPSILRKARRLTERDARRAPRPHDLARGLQPARGRIDAEGDDRVAVLVRGVEERPGRIEGEEAWHLALRRFPAHRRQHAGGVVDGEDGDAVVATVAAVDERAGWRHGDLGRGAVAGVRGRQRGDHLRRY